MTDEETIAKVNGFLAKDIKWTDDRSGYAGDVVYVDQIIDQTNPMVFVRYGSGSVRSIPVSIAVFILAFEEIKP